MSDNIYQRRRVSAAQASCCVKLTGQRSRQLIRFALVTCLCLPWVAGAEPPADKPASPAPQTSNNPTGPSDFGPWPSPVKIIPFKSVELPLPAVPVVDAFGQPVAPAAARQNGKRMVFDWDDYEAQAVQHRRDIAAGKKLRRAPKKEKKGKERGAGIIKGVRFELPADEKKDKKK